MQKRKLAWLCGACCGGVAFIGLALTLTVKHEPNFYRQSHVTPSDARKHAANTFLRQFVQMLLNIHDRQEEWGCDATEAEINSFFAETFMQRGEAETLRKLGISDPCLILEGDEVRLAFRYGKGSFSTIISYDLRIWLVEKEPNVVAVQILRARAGALPITCQSLLQQLSDFANKQNFKMTLYRHEGTPIAIVSLQPEQANPVWTLTRLEFGTQKVCIRGRTLEHALPPLTPKSLLIPVQP